MKDESKHVELNKERWDKLASSYDTKWWLKSVRNDQRKLVSLLDINEGVHFLDVGCGTGHGVGLVANAVNFKGEFYGIDLSEEMIKIAKSNFSDMDNVHFILANAESIPLDENFFDIIICTNSFHHYLHPDKALKEIHRILREDGKLYILDPTVDNWIGRMGDKMMKLFSSSHVKFYSTDEFQRMFENAGLNYTKTSPSYKRIHVGIKNKN